MTYNYLKLYNNYIITYYIITIIGSKLEKYKTPFCIKFYKLIHFIYIVDLDPQKCIEFLIMCGGKFMFIKINI